MAFNFRMILSGLLAVVPDRRFDKSVETAGSVTVLLPNLLRSTQLSQPPPLDPHHPLLDFAREDLDPKLSTHPIDLENRRLKRGVCVLIGQEVELLPVPFLARTFEVVGGRPMRVSAPTERERQSLFWLATMEEAAPGRRLLPGLLDGKVGPQRPIVARLKLGQGRLKTHRLSDLPCRFEPPTGRRFARHVAVSLALEIDNVPKHVVLALRNGQRSTRLVFAPPDGLSDVEVQLVNREPDDLFGTMHDEGPVRTEASDFEVFHSLVQRGARDSKPFLKQLVRPGDLGIRTLHQLCPPTAVNA